MKSKLLWLAAGLVVIGCVGESPFLTGARIAVKNREWTQALRNVDTVITKTPASADEAFYLKGFVYEMNFNWRSMSACYDSSLARSNKFADKIRNSRRRLWTSYYKKALAATDSAALATNGSKAWGEGLAQLDTAIIIEPRNDTLYKAAVSFAYNVENWDRTIALANKLLSIEKTGAEDFETRGTIIDCYEQKNDLENVNRVAREIQGIALKTGSEDTYLKALRIILGVYEKTGNTEGTKQALQDASQKYPDRTDLLLDIAGILLNSKDFEGAKGMYQKVLAKDAANFDANFYYGNILANEAKYKEALPYLLKALEKEPDNRTLLTNIMASYINTDQYKSAEPYKKRLDALPKE